MICCEKFWMEEQDPLNPRFWDGEAAWLSCGKDVKVEWKKQGVEVGVEGDTKIV